MTYCASFEAVTRVTKSIEGASDAADIFALFSDYCSMFGFESVALGHLANPAAKNIADGDWFHFSTWPEDWYTMWLEREYLFDDPIAAEAARRNKPFTWDTAYDLAGKAGREILDSSRDFGFKSGLAIPVHDYLRPTGIVTLGAEDIDLAPNEMRALTLVSYLVYSRLEELVDIDIDPQINALTEWERKLMMMLAAGNTDKQIARRVDRSPHTVRDAILRACKKLGTTRRTTACARAAAMGLILDS